MKGGDKDNRTVEKYMWKVGPESVRRLCGRETRSWITSHGGVNC